MSLQDNGFPRRLVTVRIGAVSDMKMVERGLKCIVTNKRQISHAASQLTGKLVRLQIATGEAYPPELASREAHLRAYKQYIDLPGLSNYGVSKHAANVMALTLQRLAPHTDRKNVPALGAGRLYGNVMFCV
jgi:hypothetical protein